jgi:small subunit ribosomal protein S8
VVECIAFIADLVFVVFVYAKLLVMGLCLVCARLVGEEKYYMSMQDPISDMLTRVRNAQKVAKKAVKMPSTKLKVAVAGVLKKTGYIEDYSEAEIDNKKELTVTLKYYNNQPVINNIRRVSRPGLRVYKGKDKLPKVKGGLGIAIISTSNGVMSDHDARSIGKGGEILCYVS